MAGGLLSDDAEVNETDAIVAEKDDVAGVWVTIDVIGAYGGIEGFATNENNLFPDVGAGEFLGDVGDGFAVLGHTHNIGESGAFDEILDDDVLRRKIFVDFGDDDAGVIGVEGHEVFLIFDFAAVVGFLEEHFGVGIVGVVVVDDGSG